MTNTAPAGAYADLLARVLPETEPHPTWASGDGPMPALFVSHGAPPTLDDPIWLDQLHRWGRSLPKPKAIVIVSAHWDNAPPALSGTAPGTPLLYDFGGFHPHYYSLTYDTPDASDLGRRLGGLLETGGGVHEFVNRGLDHGAFIPLMAMYPAADIPVVQLSMPSLEPEALLRLGTRLRPLRDEGVLVIGSGFMTHSFAVMRQPELAAHAASFDEWAVDAVARGDVDSLIDFRRRAPGVRVAHPTSDHFVPLLLSVGVADDLRSATSRIDRFVFGNSTRSLQLV